MSNLEYTYYNEKIYYQNNLEERDSEIKKVESDMIEINGIYKDLSQILNQQGQQLDNIEYNIESTLISTDKANKNLKKAEKYQKKGRRKLFILLGVVVVITVIIVIAVFA